MPASCSSRCGFARRRERRSLPSCRFSTRTCTTATTRGTTSRPRRRSPSCAGRASSERWSRAPATRARSVSSRRRPTSCCRRFARIALAATSRRGSATNRSARFSRIASRASRYVAIGEFHLYGADADLPVPRRMVALAKAAWSRAACAFRCRRDRAHVTPGSGGSHSLGALGVRAARRHSRVAREAPQSLVRPRVSQRAGRRRQGARRVARALHGVSGSVHGRHRHLHAGALALHRRACGVVARLARGSAAAALRAHRVAQRRRALRDDAARSP